MGRHRRRRRRRPLLQPLLTAPLFAWSLTNGIGFPLDVWLLFLLSATCAAANAVLGASLPPSIDAPRR